MTKLLKVVIVLAVSCVWARQAQAALSYDGHMDIIVTMNCSAGVSVDGSAFTSTYTIASTGLGSAYLVPGSSATVKNTSTCASTLWQMLVSTMATIGGTETAGWKHHSSALVDVTHKNNSDGSACLLGCPNADEYGFQALFASSMTAAGAYGVTDGCPAASATAWDTNVSTIATRSGWATADVRITTGSANTYWNTQYTWTGNSNSKSGLNTPDNFGGYAGYMGPFIPANGTGIGQRALCTRVTMPSSVSADTNNVPQVIRLSIYATHSL